MNRREAYITALASFGAKGLCSFAITYMLANSLKPQDFGLWAAMFSFGTILSVADLGIGQLILTSFHEKGIRDFDEDRLVTNAVVAMVILGVLVWLLTSIVFSVRHVLENVRWRELLVATILLRLVFIPHGAFLMARERFHERKLVEAASYSIAAGFVLWGIRARADISTLLLGMNVVLTLGSLTIAVRARQLGMASLKFDAIVPREIRQVFADSFPYFVSNVSGLVIYGGFIALSAIVLDALELARLSLLHNLVLMHLFQVFDLVFRSVQPRMRDAALMGKLKALVALSYCCCLVTSLFVGGWLFAHFFPKYRYTPGELAVYTTFAFLEVYYQMLMSSMQMRSEMRKTLQWLGIVKVVVFVALLMLMSIISNTPSVMLYSALLVLYSMSMAYLGRKGASHSSVMSAQAVCV